MNDVLNKIDFKIRKLEEFKDGIKYNILIKVPMKIGFIERMKFITETSTERVAHQLKHVKNEDGYVYFSGDIFLETKALYHYYFSFEANHNFIYYKKSNCDNTWSISKDDMWKMSVNFKVPDWAKGKIMYHIFVDRFNRGNKSLLREMPNRTIHKDFKEDIVIGPDDNGNWNTDFYGGDLQGIIDKLPYIKSLGVSILYLSPIVKSQSNHRYDTADYEVVDPYVGTNNDLKRLCDAAHKLGMKIILDAVFNHTGNDSKYFNQFNHFSELGAFQSKESKYYDFYRKHEFNNQIYFDYWWGMRNLPVCDGYSRHWQNYIYGENGIIDKWFKLGIDGLRLDVADELTDEFIEGIRTAVKRNKPDGFILGEVWKNPMRMNRGYLESGKGLDSVMNYQLVDALIRYFKYSDVEKLRNKIGELREYPKETIDSLMNFTSTHDITRAINIFGTDEFNPYQEWAWDVNNQDREYQKNYKLSDTDYQNGKKLYKAYLSALTFLPGNLSIFYGDEIGLEGLGNLANRRPFTWNKIDKDLLSYFQLLGSIRQYEKYLERADLELVDVNDKYFIFRRFTDREDLLFYVNRTNYKIDLCLPNSFRNSDILFRNNASKNNLDSYGSLVLKKVKR